MRPFCWPDEINWDGKLPPPYPNAPCSPSEITLAEIIHSYRQWAETYYRPTETHGLTFALRLLRQFFGSLAAARFGPNRLRELREAMIKGDPTAAPPRRAWSRRYVNAQLRRLQQMFKWASSRT